MKATICFKLTRTYYYEETVEVDNLVEARRTGCKLLDSMSFVDTIDDCCSYEERDVEVDCVYGTDDNVTLTNEHIKDYLGEDWDE